MWFGRGAHTVRGNARMRGMDAILHTSAGDIVIELLPHHAPKTVKNFVELATGARTWTNPATGEETNEPLYNGTVFHRVIPNFMVQGGDPLGTGTGGPGFEFDDEIHPELHFREPYVLAMANAGKRMGRGTNGSQFFITTAATTHLQGKHTIFGKVKDPASTAVVDRIGSTPTGPNKRAMELFSISDPRQAPGDAPVEDVVINSIEIVD